MDFKEFNENLNNQKLKKLQELNLVGTTAKGLEGVKRGFQKKVKDAKNMKQKFQAQQSVEKQHTQSVIQNNKTSQQMKLDSYTNKLKSLAAKFYKQIKNNKIDAAIETEAAFNNLLNQAKNELNKNESLIERILLEIDSSGNTQRLLQQFDQLSQAMNQVQPDFPETINKFTQIYNNLGKTKPNQFQSQNKKQQKESLPQTWQEFEKYIHGLANNEHPDWEKRRKRFEQMGMDNEYLENMKNKIPYSGEAKEEMIQEIDKIKNIFFVDSEKEEQSTDTNKGIFQKGGDLTQDDLKKMYNSLLNTITDEELNESKLFENYDNFVKFINQYLATNIDRFNEKNISKDQFVKTVMKKPEIIKKKIKSKYPQEWKAIKQDLQKLKKQREPDTPIDPDDKEQIKSAKSHEGKIQIKDEFLTDRDIEDLYNSFRSSINESKLFESNVPDEFVDWLKNIVKSTEPIITDKEHFMKIIKQGRKNYIKDIETAKPGLYKQMKQSSSEQDSIKTKTYKDPDINRFAKKLKEKIEKADPADIKKLLDRTKKSLLGKGMNNIKLSELDDEKGLTLFKTIINVAAGGGEEIKESIDDMLFKEHLIYTAYKESKNITWKRGV